MGNVLNAMPRLAQRKRNRENRRQKIEKLQRRIHLLKMVLDVRWPKP